MADTKYSRRDFLKNSALLAAVGASVGNIKNANAQSLGSGTDLADILWIDPITLGYSIFGACCWYCQTHRIVFHFRPAAYVEVLRSTVDTALTNLNNPPVESESTIVLKEGYHASEARIWRIPDWVIDLSMGFQSCRLCHERYLPRHINSDRSGTDFCTSTQLLREAMSLINSALPSCFPSLLYDSTVDAVAWRTGCHDVARVNTYASAVTCKSESAVLRQECLGKWGAKYPRQMAKIDSDPRRAAFVAAMRSISRAGDAGLLPFSGDSRIGKIQQVRPDRAVGWPAGTNMGDRAMRRNEVSRNGTYGFVWWLPVGCCKDYREIYSFCRPKIPCFGDTG